MMINIKIPNYIICKLNTTMWFYSINLILNLPWINETRGFDNHDFKTLTGHVDIIPGADSKDKTSPLQDSI